MGLDIHATIVVGEKVKLYTRKVKVTRYHENTGEKYEKEQKINVFVFDSDLTDVPLSLLDNDEIIFINDEGNRERNQDGIIGIELKSTGSHRSGKGISEMDIKSLDFMCYKQISGREGTLYLCVDYNY